MKFASGLATLLATACASSIVCHYDGSVTVDMTTSSDKFLRSAKIDGCTGLEYDTDGYAHQFRIPSSCMSPATVGTTAMVELFFSPNEVTTILTKTGTKQVNCLVKNTYVITYDFANVVVGEEELDDTTGNVLSFGIQRYKDAEHTEVATPEDLVRTNDMVYLSIFANNFNPDTHQYIPVYCEVSQGENPPPTSQYVLFNLSTEYCVEDHTKTKLTKGSTTWDFEFEAFAFDLAGGLDYKIQCSLAVCAVGDECQWEFEGTTTPALHSTCESDSDLIM